MEYTFLILSVLMSFGAFAQSEYNRSANIHNRAFHPPMTIEPDQNIKQVESKRITVRNGKEETDVYKFDSKHRFVESHTITDKGDKLMRVKKEFYDSLFIESWNEYSNDYIQSSNQYSYRNGKLKSTADYVINNNGRITSFKRTKRDGSFDGAQGKRI